MCNEAVMPDGETVDRVGDLRRRLDVVVYNRSYEDGIRRHGKVDDGDCLCCVDFEATAKANDISCSIDDDCSTWIFKEAQGAER